MNVNKISSTIASWSLMFVGLGHTIIDLTSPKTTLQNDFILKMKAFPIEIAGTHSNIFSFHQGFSLMMGLLLFGYGLLNLLIVKNNQTSVIPNNILILNVIICLISLVLSVQYFFIVPIVFTALAFFGYMISLTLNFKK